MNVKDCNNKDQEIGYLRKHQIDLLYIKRKREDYLLIYNDVRELQTVKYRVVLMPKGNETKEYRYIYENTYESKEKNYEYNG